jgi:hypothetical protein
MTDAEWLLDTAAFLESFPTGIHPERVMQLRQIAERMASKEAHAAKLEAVIYHNCDPFDANEEDASMINEIGARLSYIENTIGLDH